MDGVEQRKEVPPWLEDMASCLVKKTRPHSCKASRSGGRSTRAEDGAAVGRREDTHAGGSPTLISHSFSTPSHLHMEQIGKPPAKNREGSARYGRRAMYGRETSRKDTRSTSAKMRMGMLEEEFGSLVVSRAPHPSPTTDYCNGLEDSSDSEIESRYIPSVLSLLDDMDNTWTDRDPHAELNFMSEMNTPSPRPTVSSVEDRLFDRPTAVRAKIEGGDGPSVSASTSVGVQVGSSAVDKDLEESWSSLNLFDQKHRGRLQRKPRAVGLKAEVHHQSEEEEPLTPSPSAARLPPKQRSVTEHLQQQRQQEEDFVIPELPSGKSLVLDITSTWGDRHYLGLNGIEIFSVTGELVQISDTRANPADINILPEYGGKDPRVAANLTDRVNRTRDDMHLWLTPFTQGKHHFVNITFAKVETIAMIRIWNYNKSRIHSYRGAKDVTITLDGRMIFKGEIARASGGILGATDSFGDTILYTTEDSILERVAENDDSFNSVMNLSVPEPAVTISNDRPLTADIGDVRPLTCVGVDNLGSWGSCGAVLVLQEVALRLVSSWQANGHARLGLTGLDVLGETGQPVRVATIETDPPTTDPHILARLLDGSNETTNEDEMWIADGPPPVTVHLKFTSPVHVCAIVVWNYNASPELSYCGVRQIEIYVDNKLLKEDVLVRKAPGHCQYPIGQRIGLALAQHNHSAGATAHQPHQPPQPLLKYTLYTPSGQNVYEEYESPEMPSGFVFQLVLLSTWGDHYYVGLNGIEFYDPNCRIIQLSENNICAYPASVNILEDSGGKDVRTPDKLIDGINNTTDGSHMWLAPILPGKLNSVYVIFDVSTTVSMIKLWNYAKTPTRGVKEFGILVDDLLVYNGVLDKVNLNTTYSEGSKPCHVPYRTVIFSREKETTAKGRNPTLGGQKGLGAQNGQHGRVVAHSADQSKRPHTSLQMVSTDHSRSKSVMDF